MNIRYVARARKKFLLLAFKTVLAGACLFAAAVGVRAGGSPPVILAFGDSLTAGFGVPESESYPSRLQVTLKQNGYPHRVINGGLSGDTTAGGVRRIGWLLKHNPDIVILNLGANDGLRGLSLEEMQSNLEKIIQTCKERGARVLLAGMKITPNLGEDYAGGFEKVYTRLADKYGLPLIPFLLEGVAAKREHTMADGLHPVASGYRIVAATVWKHLQPMLDAERRGP